MLLKKKIKFCNFVQEYIYDTFIAVIFVGMAIFSMALIIHESYIIAYITAFFAILVLILMLSCKYIVWKNKLEFDYFEKGYRKI